MRYGKEGDTMLPDHEHREQAEHTPSWMPGVGVGEAASSWADAEVLARYQALFAHMAEGAVFQDEAGRIIDANPAALRLLGLTLDQLRGRTSFDPRWHAIHVDGSEAPGEEHPAMVALRTGKAVTDAILGVFIPGAETHRWLRISAIPQLLPGHERPVGVFVTFDDITERRRVERLMREQTEQLTRTFEAMGDSVYIYDRDGQLVQMNAAARALSGYDEHPQLAHESAHERLSRLRPRDAEGRPVPPEAWPVMRVLSGEVISSAAPAELIVTNTAGHEVIQHITGAPVHDAEGQVVGAVMVSRDVTAQRQLERQRTDILRVVAHDLANPLAAVKMYVQTQQRSVRQGKPPRVPDSAFLATMSQAVERMQRLLGDMRVVVGLEANELSLDLGPCDLVALCQQEVQTVGLATERDVRITLPNGPVVISADRDRIGQVLANLLSNADKYSPTEHPITLTLRIEPAQRHAEPRADSPIAQWARVLIRDEGPGIPRDEQAHIWERFHRVAGVQARPGTGGSLGLGLYISREITERHGGAIGVESAPGAGSTFWFKLPLAAP